MILYDLLQLAYALCLALTCAVTAWRGATPEKLGAAIVLVGSIATVGAAHIPGLELCAAKIGILVVDLLVLAGFVALVLTTDRFWPLWACGFHLVGVATHIAMLVYPDILPQAYRVVQGLWAYPMMLAIALGTLCRTRPMRTNEEA